MAVNSRDKLLKIENILKSNANEVTRAFDGEYVLHACSSTSFDLVLLDLDLPSMNGLRVSHELRVREKLLDLPRVPVVAMSPTLSSKLSGSSIDEVLQTPVHPDQLLSIVNTWVDRRPRILIMHQDISYRNQLKSALRHCNGKVAIASSKSEALTLLRLHRIDAAILDEEAKDISGPQLLCDLRKAGFSGPALGLSQDLHGPKADTWRYAGTHEVFSGSSDPDSLVQSIASALTQSPERDIDPDLADLLPRYLEDRKNDLCTMSTALMNGEYEIIRRKAHQIRGTGASYGYPELTTLAKQIATALGTQRYRQVNTLIAEMNAIIG